MRAQAIVMVAVAACAACASASPTLPSNAAPSRDRDGTYSYRVVFASVMFANAVRTTLVLAISGADVTLTEQMATASMTGLAELDRAARWRAEPARVYRGRIQDDGASFAVSVVGPGARPLALRCTPATVDVASPGATRVPGSTCGEGAWTPPATTRVAVLACEVDAAPVAGRDPLDDADAATDYVRPAGTRLAFVRGADPSLELAWVDDLVDHCRIRGGGYRRVALR